MISTMDYKALEDENRMVNAKLTQYKKDIESLRRFIEEYNNFIQILERCHNDSFVHLNKEMQSLVDKTKELEKELDDRKNASDDFYKRNELLEEELVHIIRFVNNRDRDDYDYVMGKFEKYDFDKPYDLNYSFHKSLGTPMDDE